MSIFKKYQSSRKVTTVLIFILFFLVNWFSYSFYIRFDVSKTGRLRLTSATKEILPKLPEKVTLEAFFSSKVPDAYLQQVKQARDFLKEYSGASKGKVKLIFLDPSSNEAAKERANTLGVPQTQIGVQGEGDLEVKQIYLAVVLSYGDKVEKIQNVIDTRALEYDLTSRIFRMSHPGERGLGLVTVKDGFTVTASQETQQNPYKSLEAINSVISPFYGAIKEVNTTKDDLPADVSTLFVLAPDNLTEADKFKIDQFIMRGGNVIFGVSGLPADLSSGKALPLAQATLDFIANYGIIIEKNIALEPRNFIPIRRQIPGNPFAIQNIEYPFWVVLKNNTLNSDNIITRGLPGLFIPWGSGLKIDSTKLLKETTEDSTDKSIGISVLASTTPEAFSAQDDVFISPQYLGLARSNADKTRRVYNLITYSKGKYNSAFANVTVKSVDGTLTEDMLKTKMSKSEKNSKILVVSTPYFFSSPMLQQAEQYNLTNINLLLNALDSMNGLDELIESRSKNVSDPLLPSLKPWEIKTWTMINFMVPLIAILVYALIHLLRRKRMAGLKYE